MKNKNKDSKLKKKRYIWKYFFAVTLILTGISVMAKDLASALIAFILAYLFIHWGNKSKDYNKRIEFNNSVDKVVESLNEASNKILENLNEVESNFTVGDTYDELNPPYTLEDDERKAFLIDWTMRNSIKDEKYYFPKYLTYNFGIKNPSREQLELFKNGYIKQSTFEDSMNLNTVNELKDILRENNLKISGRKAELIERLNENLPDDIKSKLIESTPAYTTADKGKELLKEHGYIAKAFRDRHITVPDAILEKETLPDWATFNDIRWSILNKQSFMHDVNRNYGRLSMSTRAMAEVLMEEQDYINSAVHYIHYFFLSYSGLDNNFGSFDKTVASYIITIDYDMKNWSEINSHLNDEDFKRAFIRAIEMFQNHRDQGEMNKNEIAKFAPILRSADIEKFNKFGEYMKKKCDIVY